VWVGVRVEMDVGAGVGVGVGMSVCEFGNECRCGCWLGVHVRGVCSSQQLVTAHNRYELITAHTSSKQLITAHNSS